MPNLTPSEYAARQQATKKAAEYAAKMERKRNRLCGCGRALPIGTHPKVGSTVLVSFQTVAVVDSISSTCAGADKLSVKYELTLKSPVYTLKFTRLPKKIRASQGTRLVRNFNSDDFTIVESKGEFYIKAYSDEFYTCDQEPITGPVSSEA